MLLLLVLSLFHSFAAAGKLSPYHPCMVGILCPAVARETARDREGTHSYQYANAHYVSGQSGSRLCWSPSFLLVDEVTLRVQGMSVLSSEDTHSYQYANAHYVSGQSGSCLCWSPSYLLVEEVTLRVQGMSVLSSCSSNISPFHAGSI